MNHECGSPRPAELGGPRLAGGRHARHLRAARVLLAQVALDGGDHAIADRGRDVRVDDPAQDLDRADGPRAVLAAQRADQAGLHEHAVVRDVAATSAIWSGVTNVSAWPYAAFASSTSSTKPPGCEPLPFVTWDGAVGRSNGSGAPNPMLRGVVDEVAAADRQAGQRVPDVARHLGRLHEVESAVAGRRMVAVRDPEPVDDEPVLLGGAAAARRSCREAPRPSRGRRSR